MSPSRPHQDPPSSATTTSLRSNSQQLNSSSSSSSTTSDHGAVTASVMNTFTNKQLVSSTSKNNDSNTTAISTLNSNTTSLHSSNNINISTGTATSTLLTNQPRIRRGLRLKQKQNLFDQPTMEFSMVMIIINICIYGLYTSFQANNLDGIKIIIYIVIINIVIAHTMRLRFYRYQVLTQKVEHLETIINNATNNNSISNSTSGIISNSSSSSSKYTVSDVNNNDNNFGNDIHDSGYCADSNNVVVSDNNINNDHQVERMNGMPIAGMTTS
jgi:hypothetical protein